MVSTDRRTRVRRAGAAYIFNSRPPGANAGGSGREAKYAPIGGPIMKQIAKAMPTWARALDRFAGVVISEMIALWPQNFVRISVVNNNNNAHCELNVSFAQSSNSS